MSGLTLTPPASSFDLSNVVARVLTPHRYWRIRILANGDPTAVNLEEMELREVAGGSDVTGGGATYSATETSVSGPIANLFDNDSSTVWSTNTSPTFPVDIIVDFGSGNAKVIQEISILPWSVAPARTPASFTIDRSDDGATFTNSWSVSGVSWTTAAQAFTKP